MPWVIAGAVLVALMVFGLVMTKRRARFYQTEREELVLRIRNDLSVEYGRDFKPDEIRLFARRVHLSFRFQFQYVRVSVYFNLREEKGHWTLYWSVPEDERGETTRVVHVDKERLWWLLEHLETDNVASVSQTLRMLRQ